MILQSGISELNPERSSISAYEVFSRSVFHTWTNDYVGSRQGNRVVSIGEKPYFDTNSVSRREALRKAAEVGE